MKDDPLSAPDVFDRRRNIYLLTALAISAITKFVPLGPLTDLARGYGHDVALPIFGYMMVSPKVADRWISAAFIFVFCSTGELLQLFIEQPADSALPILGTFDPWDFLAYALGVSAALALDFATLSEEDRHVNNPG